MTQTCVNKWILNYSFDGTNTDGTENVMIK